MILASLICVFAVTSICLFAAFFFAENNCDQFENMDTPSLDAAQQLIKANFEGLSQNADGHLVNSEGEVVFRRYVCERPAIASSSELREIYQKEVKIVPSPNIYRINNVVGIKQTSLKINRGRK